MSKEITYTCRTKTVEGTKQLAGTLSRHVAAGDVVVLSGDLGAGKTQFVQGVAAGLGVSADVTSPTFNILLAYEDGRIPLYHFDLYRLDDPDELEDIDYFSYVEGEGDGVAFVEWGEKFPDDMPLDYLAVSIVSEGDGSRCVRACAQGLRSTRLLEAWADDPESVLVKE